MLDLVVQLIPYVCLKGLNMCKRSGIGLDLACNLIVLLFHVSNLHCIRVC